MIEKIKETCRKIKKQYFTPPCVRYMKEVVERLDVSGIDMHIEKESYSRLMNCAYSEKDEIYFTIVHTEKHFKCWIEARIGRNVLDDDIIKPICRQQWGEFYFDVEGNPIGLSLDYPNKQHSPDERSVYLSPKRLAEDLEFVVRSYLSEKNKQESKGLKNETKQ